MPTESDLYGDPRPRPTVLAPPGREGPTTLQPGDGSSRRHADRADRRRQDDDQKHPPEGASAAADDPERRGETARGH